jgi:molybdopterin-containing oxidoreductase family iron-sulfur binding subunit
MDRRTFLRLAAAGSLTFTVACGMDAEELLYSQVRSPEDMVSGKAHWYATTCRHCPAGCGVLAKNREGRVVKLEGNPLHPINRGKLCIRGQSSLQAVYHPDRLRKPQLRENGAYREISFERAIDLLRRKLDAASSKGENRVRMMTELEGGSLMGLFEECLRLWRSPGPFVYEPLTFDHLKKANEIVFGVTGLPAYRMEECDFLLGFGADFLETWLSPVEYARKFKAMHAAGEDGRGPGFFHAGPVRTVTCANADQWIRCRPEAKAPLCLGLIREALRDRGSAGIPETVARELEEVAGGYSPERVRRLTGIDERTYGLLADRMLRAESPLVLGTSGASHSGSDLQTCIAANLLNYVLDPGLKLVDFTRRHRIGLAPSRAEQEGFLREVREEADVLLLNNVDPAFSMPDGSGFKGLLRSKGLFTVCFSNFWDESALQADLVLPVALPLESWGEYGGDGSVLSTLQPAMTSLHGAPLVGDVLVRAAGGTVASCRSVKEYLIRRVEERFGIAEERRWLQTLASGGSFDRDPAGGAGPEKPRVVSGFARYFARSGAEEQQASLMLLAVPSIRFYDGRGANLPWLCEIPDPITKVAWQSTVMMHPDTAARFGVEHGGIVRVGNGSGSLAAAAYVADHVVDGVLAVPVGQGHIGYGRYARGRGANPFRIMPREHHPVSGAGPWALAGVSLRRTGRKPPLAHTDGSSDQLGRTIALTATAAELRRKPEHGGHGLGMHEFPMTPPLPEGYDPRRDFYPPHKHAGYRWAMTVDLDRCIGCNACAAACYAENSVGVSGEEGVISGREMSWLHIERYRQTGNPDKLVFLPMLCQHCDNAPCESVCPVYAPHHNKEGINNQIYNRCIGTRFCAQNCPYKVRKFNWFEWTWPEPLNLQLNPDVTVRTKGVMEKCSFCIQRIKEAHTEAKREGRSIRDGEVTPACVQTCPTDALVFGSLLDPSSRVSRLAADRRAYQVLGYLNTKPAVLYLKKVVGRTGPEGGLR